MQICIEIFFGFCMQICIENKKPLLFAASCVRPRRRLARLPGAMGHLGSGGLLRVLADSLDRGRLLVGPALGAAVGEQTGRKFYL